MGKKQPDNSSIYKEMDESLLHFCSLLENEKIDEAFKWQQENRIPLEEIMPNAVDAFNKFKGKRNHRAALQIGLKYQFEPNLINPLYLAEWNRLYKNGQFEDAAQWAKEQNLSEVELRRSSHKAYENYLKEGRVEDAFRVIKNYDIVKEAMLEITLSEYNKAYEENDFLKAAMLGKEFGFSLKRTSLAAIYQTLNDLKTGEFRKAVGIIHDFYLLSDDVFEVIPEEDGKNLVKDIVKYLLEPGFENDKFHLLDDFAKKADLVDRTVDNHLLQALRSAMIALAVKKHNSLLKDGNIKSARSVRKSFFLFSAPVPQKFFVTMLDEAILHHRRLLENGELDEAVKIKNEYGFFTNDLMVEKKDSIVNDAVKLVIRSMENQDFISAKRLIDEYMIPGHLISESVFKSVFDLFRQYHYSDILKIFDSIKLNPDEESIAVNLISVFQKFIEKKEYIYAAEYATKVRLAKSYAHDAALRGWKVFFLEKNFDKALSIKTRFKLPGKMTLETATNMYWNLVDKGEYSEASGIRRNYKVSLSIMQWFKELFNIIFSKNSPAEKDKKSPFI